jgi:hypothetical protein
MRKCRWDTAVFSGISAYGVAPDPGWSVAQTYSYDKLNRVLLAKEPSISGGQGWKRSCNYDRWSNQWVDATNFSGINVFSAAPTRERLDHPEAPHQSERWLTPKRAGYLNSSGTNSCRSRRQVSHSCAVPGDSQ